MHLAHLPNLGGKWTKTGAWILMANQLHDNMAGTPLTSSRRPNVRSAPCDFCERGDGKGVWLLHLNYMHNRDPTLWGGFEVFYGAWQTMPTLQNEHPQTQIHDSFQTDSKRTNHKYKLCNRDDRKCTTELQKKKRPLPQELWYGAMVWSLREGFLLEGSNSGGKSDCRTTTHSESVFKQNIHTHAHTSPWVIDPPGLLGPTPDPLFRLFFWG